MTLKNKSLSVIIPIYNAGKYISFAINSVLTQTFSDLELIIINDGSTDNSKSIIDSFDDKRIKYFENDSNRGIVYSRNRGVSLAKGKYIGMLDADDVAYPDKFEKQINFLEKNRDFGFVGSWVRFIDEDGNSLPGRWKLKAKPEEIPAIMLFKNYFLQSAVLYRKEIFEKYSFTKGFDILEDYLLWYQITKKYKVANFPEYLVDYRLHDKGVTKQHNKERREKERKVFQIMLNDLGITPDENDLDLHMIIREGNTITNPEILKAIESWLLKIYSTNCKTKVYNPAILSKVLINRWLKVCRKTKGFTVTASKLCMTSQILSLYFYGCKSLSKINRR